MPGYVLVKMLMTDEAYHLHQEHAQGHGLPRRGRPAEALPVPQKEVDQILGKVATGTVERARPKMQFEIGEKVKVTDGPFASFEGAVNSIDEDAGRLKVTVTISAGPPRSISNIGQVVEGVWSYAELAPHKRVEGSARRTAHSQTGGSPGSWRLYSHVRETWRRNYSGA